MYGVRSALKEEGVKSKLSEEEIKQVEDAVSSVLEWISKNELAEQEEFEYKMKEVETTCAPIIKKIYEQGGGAGGQGMPGMGGMGGSAGPGAGESGGKGPKVEEVD